MPRRPAGCWPWRWCLRGLTGRGRRRPAGWTGRRFGEADQETFRGGLLKKSLRLALRSCRKSLRCEQQCSDQDKQDRLRQSLEVDGGCGEKGLNFHVLEAASGCPVHAVEGLGQPVCALDQPAVAAVEAPFLLTPGQSFAAGAQNRDMGIADMDPARCPRVGNASRARRGQARQASASARNQRPVLVVDRGVSTFLRGQRTRSCLAS